MPVPEEEAKRPDTEEAQQISRRLRPRPKRKAYIDEPDDLGLHTDDQSAEEEEEQQPGSSHVTGSQGRHRRKQQVIGDDNLPNDTGAEPSTSKPPLSMQEQGDSDNDSSMNPASRHQLPASHTRGEIQRSKELLSKCLPNADAVQNAAPYRGDLSLLDAMLNPDGGSPQAMAGLAAAADMYTAQKAQAQIDCPGSSQTAEHAHTVTAPLSEPQTVGQEVNNAQAEQVPVSKANPSRPAIKGSLRERMKAFAAMKK